MPIFCACFKHLFIYLETETENRWLHRSLLKDRFGVVIVETLYGQPFFLWNTNRTYNFHNALFIVRFDGAYFIMGNQILNKLKIFLYNFINDIQIEFQSSPTVEEEEEETWKIELISACVTQLCVQTCRVNFVCVRTHSQWLTYSR